MSREEIQIRIDEITKQMKGPLTDLERVLLHNDRADLRALLKAEDELNG